MKESTDLGSNRTGIGTAPRLASRMREGTEAFTPAGSAEEWHRSALHAAYLEEADPIGTMPPPSSLKGAAATGRKALKGENANVLLDKLGERLAFERSGARLYEAFLRKLEVWGPPDVPGGPSLVEAREICEEEKRHFALVHDAIESLGADPTVMTPCADVAMVASGGILEVMADPRTDLAQCLDVLLQAELTDNAGWTLLISLAEAMGQDEMAQDFQAALENEEKHLALVREWLTRVVHARAGASANPKTTKKRR